MSDNYEIWTIDEVMDYLLIGRNTLYNLLRKGKIKGFKIGSCWKIPKKAVDDYSLFVNPSVMKIMCFFLSCGHFGKVLHKHLTVFLIDCRQRIIQKSAGYHKAIHRSLRKLQFTILYVKYIEEIVHALRNSFHQFSRCHFFK